MPIWKSQVLLFFTHYPPSGFYDLFRSCIHCWRLFFLQFSTITGDNSSTTPLGCSTAAYPPLLFTSSVPASSSFLGSFSFAKASISLPLDEGSSSKASSSLPHRWRLFFFYSVFFFRGLVLTINTLRHIHFITTGNPGILLTCED